MRLPELNEDEHEALLLMCGFAVGAAMRDNRKLAYSFLRLTNKLNEGNPNYLPYEIPEEEDEIAGKVT